MSRLRGAGQVRTGGPPRPGRLALLAPGAIVGLVAGLLIGEIGSDGGSRAVRGVVTNVAADGTSLCIGGRASATEGPCARPALLAGQRLPEKGDRVVAELLTVPGRDGGPGVTVFVFPEEAQG